MFGAQRNRGEARRGSGDNRQRRVLAAATGAALLAAASLAVGQSLEQEAPQAAAAAEPAPPGPGVATSEVCSRCHAFSPDARALRDERGRSVAPYDLWQSTMMANSARDPFWRAVMSAEIAATPNAKDAIVSKCLKCHTPLADRVGLDVAGLENLPGAIEGEDEFGELAQDGVSCTICHGIADEGLGTPESFTAGFTLNDQLHLYGPHDEVFPRPMEMVSGFTPHYGAHMTRSKLCGSCHTLVTDALDPEGNEVGMQLHEQTPYLEWRNSIFSDEEPDGTLMEEPPSTARTCQACHMPTTDVDGRPIETRIAHNPFGIDFGFVEERSPFGRHLFVGGNAYMLTMLRDNAEELGVKAPAEAFDATIAATREQLGERSAKLVVEAGATPGAFDVTVTNLTGHKLPSGHPSRRMWLEVTALDAGGNELFRSGAPNEEGLIVGPDGEVLPTERRGGPVEPHRQVIERPDQVARFRAIMADAEGAPTYSLLRGAQWMIDDRVLPRGWRGDHPDAPKARPYGTGEDTDFAPEGPSSGTDTVTYRLPEGTATVRARLLYQTLSPRYVVEALAYETPEIERFMKLYEASDRAPEVLATAVWSQL